MERIKRYKRFTDGVQSGTLMNIDGDFDKFFIISKGSPYAITYATTPFYHMFEELGGNYNGAYNTSNTNVYDKMSSGEVYKVDHICTSVLETGHAYAMQSWTYDPSSPSKHANLMVYMPERRCSPLTGGSDHNLYSVDHQPGVFFYHVSLAEPVVGGIPEYYEVPVTLTWTSNLKSVTKDAVLEEEYTLMRSEDGGATWEAIDPSLVTVTQSGTTFNTRGDNLFRRHADGTVTMTYEEKRDAQKDYTILYKVMARIGDTNFTPEWSNEQPVTILKYQGLSTKAYNPHLAIRLCHQSTYDDNARANHYTNKIYWTPVQKEPLRRHHFTQNTVIKLVRYTKDDKSQSLSAVTGKEVLTGKVKSIEEGARGKEFTIQWTDPNGKAVGQDLKLQFQPVNTEDGAAYQGGDYDVLTQSRDIGIYGLTPVEELTDKFDFSTADGVDSHTYTYVLNLSGLAYTYTSRGNAQSNVAECTLFADNIGAGFSKYYTAQEIGSDTDHHLEPSTPCVCVSLHGHDPKWTSTQIFDTQGKKTGYLTYNGNKNNYIVYLGKELGSVSGIKGLINLAIPETFNGKEVYTVTTTDTTFCGTNITNTYGAPHTIFGRGLTITLNRDNARGKTYYQYPLGVEVLPNSWCRIYTRWTPSPGLRDVTRTMGMRGWMKITAGNNNSWSYEPYIGYMRETSMGNGDASASMMTEKSLANPAWVNSLSMAQDGHADAQIQFLVLEANAKSAKAEYFVRGYPHDPTTPYSEDRFIVIQDSASYTLNLAELEIPIEVEHKSIYDMWDLEGQFNHYLNTVTWNNLVANPLMLKHLTNTTSAPTFRLVRFTDNLACTRPTEGTEVACYQLVSTTQATDANGDAYTDCLFSLKTNSGNVSEVHCKAYPYIPDADPSLAPLQSAIPTKDKTKTPNVLVYTDKFDFSTVKEADNHTYTYRMFASNLNLSGSSNLTSNAVDLKLRAPSMKLAFTSYTAEQVAADSEHALAVSQPVVDIVVDEDAEDALFDIKIVYDSGTIGNWLKKVRATWMGKPCYNFYTYDEHYKEHRLDLPASASRHLRLPLPEWAIGKSLLLVMRMDVKKATGYCEPGTNVSYYGTPRVMPQALDSVQVQLDPDARKPNYGIQGDDVPTPYPGFYVRTYPNGRTSFTTNCIYTTWEVPEDLRDYATTMGYRAWVTTDAQSGKWTQDVVLADMRASDGTLSDVPTTDIEAQHPCSWSGAYDKETATLHGRYAMNVPSQYTDWVHNYLVRAYPHEPGTDNDSYYVIEGRNRWGYHSGTITGLDSPLYGAGDGPAVYYNLQGQEVTDPLDGEIYVRRTPTSVTKVRYRAQ